MQHYHILMRELENSVTQGETEVSILHATALVKAILPFDFVNTSGQKPSNLRAHFTQPYWALDTLLNHYY